MSRPEPRAVRRFRLAAPKPRSRLEKAVRWVVFLGLVGSLAGGLVGTSVYLYYAPTVPVFTSLADYQPKIGSRIYSADNQLIGEFAQERRVLVPFEKIPRRLLQAFIAAEDKRFYSHGGIDFIGVFQALLGKVFNPGDKLRGASTITQQVAKSLLATHESYETATERSLARKVREAILARQLEHQLTKDQIIYLYMSQMFLGHKAYGVQAAAEHYFRKNVWELSLAEMATLAGLPQRPSDYSPFSRPEAAHARRRYVLRRMAEDGYITDEEAAAAAEEELTVYPREELYLQVAPYYTEQVRRELIDRYGERALLEDGLKVYTAVNLEYQADARAAVVQGLHDLDIRQGYRGPLAHLGDKKLRAAFVPAYRKHLGLSDGEQVHFVRGKVYVGLVTGIESEGRLVKLDIAGRVGLLPLAAIRWARKPNPTERWDMHMVTDARQVLKTGDVVSVRLSDRHTIAAGKPTALVRAMPETGDYFTLYQEPIAQGALMSVDPRSGYVLAQIGGYRFEDSTYNRAVQACREPGSAFKPIVYSAAIDKLDYTASTLIDDKPIVFDDPDNAVRWKPANAGMEFRGQLPMRTCLQDSINLPAIRIANAVGIEDVIKNARRLGITTPLKRELGTAIGSSCTTLYDLTNVYVTLNRYGQRRDLRFIRRVVDRYGNVLEDHSVSWDPSLDLKAQLDRAYAELLAPERQALDEQTAFLTVSLMRNVITGGTGVGATRTGQIIAGKTGTTNDSYDAWFMAFTKNLVTGVWVGHDKKERPLGVNEQGGRTALPIWVDFIENVMMNYKASPPTKIYDGDFYPPSGVVRVAIDPDTGLLARPGSPRSVFEYYRAGSEPTQVTPDKAVFNPDQIDVYGADTPL